MRNFIVETILFILGIVAIFGLVISIPIIFWNGHLTLGFVCVAMVGLIAYCLEQYTPE